MSDAADRYEWSAESTTAPRSLIPVAAAGIGSALAELKMMRPESSVTTTRVVSEGMLWSSEPQRYSGLTSPTNVPRTSLRRTIRRSR